MRLAAYLVKKKLTYAAFGRLRDPAVPRVTVRQWALGQRFPTDPADLLWLGTITNGRVTAADFVSHAMEVREQKKSAA